MSKKTKRRKRVLLIDGDTLLYSACAVNEYEAHWDEYLHTLHCDYATARVSFEDALSEIVTGTEATSYIIALSDRANWRKRILPSYKSNRKGTRKPVSYGALRDFVVEKHPTAIYPALEGDDVLGILATDPKAKHESVIVSIDKDLKTIPGLHLNYAHAKRSGDWQGSIREVSVEDADRFHLYQTLAGDSTDGYSGCPKVGAVTAERILEADPSWAAVVAAYAKAGLGEGAALQQARVARICRWTDYDHEKEEVIPWQP